MFSISLFALTFKYFKDEWLLQAQKFLYDEVEIIDKFENDISLQQQVEAAGQYSWQICPQNKTKCLVSLTMGQNLGSMLLMLKIQNETLRENIFLMSDSVWPVESSGSTYCVGIDISQEGYGSKSGVGNGIEAIIDLETFDNNDLEITGDGADVQVIEPGDYPLAQLKGFAVSPGSAVEVHIRPALFGITKEALDFDYLARKCVEPSVDKEFNALDGMYNGSHPSNYTLSNCLVSATLTEIAKK